MGTSEFVGILVSCRKKVVKPKMTVTATRTSLIFSRSAPWARGQRAAQAGVGEEQGAAFAQARAGEREFRVRDGDARVMRLETLAQVREVDVVLRVVVLRRAPRLRPRDDARRTRSGEAASGGVHLPPKP